MATDTLTAYTEAGAISAAAGVARITAAADAAFTIADASGLTTDAAQKDISNESAATHTVTGNFVNGNLTYSKMLLAPGGFVRLRATGNAAWRVVSANRGVTVM